MKAPQTAKPERPDDQLKGGERELVSRLRRVNLNLLPILQKLLETRSVSKTAVALSLTAPAVSQALRHLRGTLGDEILVMSGRDVQLSERAEYMMNQLSRILVDLDLLLQTPNPFDPKTESAQFTIHTVDYVGMLLAPILIDLCAEAEAHGVSIEFVEAKTHGAQDLAQLDFMIAPRAAVAIFGKYTDSMELWQDEIVCIASRDNLSVGDRITPDEYRQSRHVGIHISWAPSGHGKALQPAYSFENKSVCTTPNFMVVGAIVSQTDCLALVPRRLAHLFVTMYGVRIIHVDHPNTATAIYAYWNNGSAHKRGHQWFRELLATAVEKLR